MRELLTMQEIVDLASAYYGSSVLFAALEHDLFTAIDRAGGTISVENFATGAGHNMRGVQLLMDACVAVGLLNKNGGVYANTPAAQATLVAGAPHDLTLAIKYNRDVYTAWGHLSELVRTGIPVEAPELHLGEDLERTRRFVLAMHGRALGIGRVIIPMLVLPTSGQVLDLAGGPGTYAVLMAQAYPTLRCVTVDLPAVSKVASELVSAAGLSERVTCRSGNYHFDTHETATYDVVTIFGALHQESPAMIVSILIRAYAALKPGGRIYVLDMMTDATHTSPSFSALFAVNMALTTHHGWVFSDVELHGWLSEAGFNGCETRIVPPPMPHWLVSACKPAY